jgi:hypothetical protein
MSQTIYRITITVDLPADSIDEAYIKVVNEPMFNHPTPKGWHTSMHGEYYGTVPDKEE